MNAEDRDARWMKLAIELAGKGLGLTSPNPCVGAVIVHKDQIIGSGFHEKAGLPHAERNAIADGIAKGNVGLFPDSTLYVTLEPCPMCAGAIINARIPKVFYGAKDEKKGYSVFSPSILHPKTEVVSGVMEDECASLMKEFFKQKR